MSNWIDADELKREACASKAAGKPTNAIGGLLKSLAETVAKRYRSRLTAICCEHSDAVGAILLTCIEAVHSVRCDWPAEKAFGYFVALAMNVCRNLLRDFYRRRETWERYADLIRSREDLVA